jgi:hypothetical protein
MTVSLLNDTAMSNFYLNLRLRFRYLIYSMFTSVAYFIIGSVTGQGNGGYVPGIGFLDFGISQWIAGFVALYLQAFGIASAMTYYTGSKVGAGRAFRELFEHRDVISIDTSWQKHWRSAKKIALFDNVIPANLYGLGAVLGIVTYSTQGVGFSLYFYVISCLLLAGLSSMYANEHLCSAEVNELHERPQSYKNALTHAKREAVERAAMEQVKQRLEKERKRNSPVPPQSEKQKQPPHKPY